jgi:hypothetical protein
MPCGAASTRVRRGPPAPTLEARTPSVAVCGIWEEPGGTVVGLRMIVHGTRSEGVGQARVIDPFCIDVWTKALVSATPSEGLAPLGLTPFAFPAPSHAFFLHMIGEIYDRNSSLSIYVRAQVGGWGLTSIHLAHPHLRPLIGARPEVLR